MTPSYEQLVSENLVMRGALERAGKSLHRHCPKLMWNPLKGGDYAYKEIEKILSNSPSEALSAVKGMMEALEFADSVLGNEDSNGQIRLEAAGHTHSAMTKAKRIFGNA